MHGAKRGLNRMCIHVQVQRWEPKSMGHCMPSRDSMQCRKLVPSTSPGASHLRSANPTCVYTCTGATKLKSRICCTPPNKQGWKKGTTQALQAAVSTSNHHQTSRLSTTRRKERDTCMEGFAVRPRLTNVEGTENVHVPSV